MNHPMNPNTIKGRVVEAGDLECLNGEPGLVIKTTREELMKGWSIVFQNVLVSLNEEEIPDVDYNLTP